MNKDTNVKNFNIISFVAITCTFLYIVVIAGDFLRQILKIDSYLISRYIPVGITAIIATYVISISVAKKSPISELESTKMKMFIAPLLVAVIIFVYGMISLNSNVKKIQDSSEYSFALKFGGENMINSLMDEAKKQATTNWIITAVIYLGAAEAVVFLMKNKIGEEMFDDSYTPVEPQEHIKITDSINYSTNKSEDISNKIENTNDEEQKEKIKWDL